MSSPEERAGNWRTDPGATSASGGHVTPGFGNDPLFDPLTDPLPSERAPTPGPRDEPPPGAYVPPTETYAPARPTQPAHDRTRRRRLVSRRLKRTVKHVDPMSVLKLSLFYYSILFFVWLLAVAILYSMVAATGIFESIEEFESGFVVEIPDITLGFVEKWAMIVGLILVVVGSIANVFLAFLYNVGADLFGGLEITFVERDT